MKSLQVLALTRYGRLGASSRLRTYQYVPYLEEVGIKVHIAPLLSDAYLRHRYAGDARKWLHAVSGYIRRLASLLRASSYDLLWIEKELLPEFPEWIEIAIRKSGIKYVVDYDDAIFHNYDLSRNPLRRLLSSKIDRIMRGASIVICGNYYLAKRAELAGASEIEIIPTVVDLNQYGVREPASSNLVRIGWIGTPATIGYLNSLVSALRALSGRVPLELRVIGSRFEAEGVSVVSRNWSEETEVSEIQSIDIGVMPLADTPWERGKCAYKLIQYMACGRPVVASPIGMNTEVVSDGYSGYFANTAEEWENRLAQLCASAEVRNAMGANGRRTVETRFSLSHTAPVLATVLRRAARL